MMKTILTLLSFVLAVPFVFMGFFWYFICYGFDKGKEVCVNFFEYLERP